MFGESESESPRVPSPWDSLISTPRSVSPSNPSPLAATATITSFIPKLVPEADDGNVEYKLQLLSPSPARFARLVTQLKWRLLEGGGQAYYELGVADSGALVGLPRAELEQSLETLEMMAGEIGASVIVVKEIEVPAAMVGLVESQPERWNGKQRRRKWEVMMGEGEGSTTETGGSGTGTETETDGSANTDADSAAGEDEDDEDLSATVVLVRTPSRPSDGSSSSPTLFPMEPDLDLDDLAENADAEPDEPQQQFIVDLEIASVFKPRPMRTKLQHSHFHASLVPGKNNKRSGGKVKKHMKHLFPNAGAVNTHPSHQHVPHDHHEGNTQEDGNAASSTRGGKHISLPSPSNRRTNRDRKREEKRKALMAHATGGTLERVRSYPTTAAIAVELTHGTTTFITTDATHATLERSAEVLVPGLGDLHVHLATPMVASDFPSRNGDNINTNLGRDTSDLAHVGTESILEAVAVADGADSASEPARSSTDPRLRGSGGDELDNEERQGQDADDEEDDVFASPTEFRNHGSTAVQPHTSPAPLSFAVMDGETDAGDNERTSRESGGPRLIVEALVVRKMSLEEAFLDFGGFSLT